MCAYVRPHEVRKLLDGRAQGAAPRAPGLRQVHPGPWREKCRRGSKRFRTTVRRRLGFECSCQQAAERQGPVFSAPWRRKACSFPSAPWPLSPPSRLLSSLFRFGSRRRRRQRLPGEASPSARERHQRHRGAADEAAAGRPRGAAAARQSKENCRGRSDSPRRTAEGVAAAPAPSGSPGAQRQPRRPASDARSAGSAVMQRAARARI